MSNEKYARFDREDLAIRVSIPDVPGEEYEIDLERANNAAELLDWIFQVAQKKWCTPEVLADTIQAVETASWAVFGQFAQGVFCPMGQIRRVNWRTGETTPLK